MNTSHSMLKTRQTMKKPVPFGGLGYGTEI